MTALEIYDALSEIFRDVFLRDDLALTPDLCAADITGWDSFKQIEIVIAAEQRFAIKFTTRELDRLRTIGDLVEVIAAKV